MDQASTNKIAQIDLHRVPRHVGIIMDGNGRWGKLRGQPRIFGHKNSTKEVSAAIEGCAELGIQYLTVYAFSTENFRRPAEVKTIIDLMATHLEKELDTFIKKKKLQRLQKKRKIPCLERKKLTVYRKSFTFYRKTKTRLK